MSQSSQDHTSGISGRYAFALFELIQEDYDLNELDKINEEMLRTYEIPPLDMIA